MPRFAANLTMLFTELPFLDRFAAAAESGSIGSEKLRTRRSSGCMSVSPCSRLGCTVTGTSLPPCSRRSDQPSTRGGAESSANSTA